MAKQSPKQGKGAKKNKAQDVVSKQKAAAGKAADKTATDKSASKVAADKKAVTNTKSAKNLATTAKKSDKDQKQVAKSGKGGKQAPKKESIFKKIATYFRNVRQEIKRTTWPSRDEVIRMSLIVVGALLFFGVFIFLIDRAMTALIDLYSNLDPTTIPIDTTGVDPGTTVDPGTGAQTTTDGGTTPADTTGTAGGDTTTNNSTDPATDAATGATE